MLEYYILHGKTDGVQALNFVLETMGNPKRQNPQDLDRGMISHMKKVIEDRNSDHIPVARKFNIS
jgi:hypothetical protein